MKALRAMGLVCVLFIGLLAGATAAWAQTTARFSGVVKDQSGGVVSGAAITLTNTGTNVSRATITDAEGNFLFPIVEVGTFRIAAEHPGFKKYVQSGITLEVNQNAHVDIVLQVGQAAETVEVSGDVTQVDTTSAVLGKVESERRIVDLPLVERDTLQLGLLQAGVFAPDYDDGSGNPFSVSGQRSESLTFLIDGADNNDFLGNNIVVSPNPDAVQEFKILTNNYDAQFGRTSGGIVNQVIKSGSNQLHGSLFEFFRNDVLNARDFFLPERTSFKRNQFGGTVGGAIRKDKTFFFLAYQGERRREGQVAPVMTTLSVPERSGDFSDLFTGSTDPATGNDYGQLYDPSTGLPFANNQVPVNVVSANYISKYVPLPNIGTNQFVGGPVGSIRAEQGIVRLDHNLSARDTLSFLYVVNDVADSYPFRIVNGASTGGNVPVGSGFSDLTRNQVGTLTWSHTFANGWLNEARFAANRAASLQATPADTTTPSALGFTNVNPDDPSGAAPPIMFVSGAFNLGPSPQGPTKLHDATFQGQDNFVLPRGRHEWRFGGDVRRVRNNFNYDFFNNGSFDFGSFGAFTASPVSANSPGSALADFVGGFPDNFFQFSNAVYGIRTSSYFFYAQDTWKATKRLTVTLGLRYEYNTPMTDIHNNIMGFFPGQQSTVFPGAPQSILYAGDPGTPNNGLTYPDRNNFAPRVGFSWDIFGNAKLVMRGGGGIFYDIEDGALNLQFGGQAPFGSVANLYFGPGNMTSGGILADPFTAYGTTNSFPYDKANPYFSVPAISFAFLVSPNFRTPYSENFNYGFQYQLSKDTVVEAVYVGSLGRKLISSGEVNFPQTNIEQQQLAGFNFINADCARPLAGCANPADPNGSPTGATLLLTNFSSGISASHELQVTVDKRFSKGFTVRSAYTLAKTTDLTSGFRARSYGYTNPYIPRMDHALADFDATHRLVVSGLYELPTSRLSGGNKILSKVVEGWQVGGIVTFQSGTPFTLYQNNDSSGQQNYLDRPDLVGPIQTFNARSVQTFNSTCLPGSTTGNFYFNPSSFDCTNVAQFTYGTLGRNTLRGPGINNWDVSIIKRIKITESKNLEFRSEFFNAFNHAQFMRPDNQGFSGTFGQVTSARAPRLIQFGLKLYY